MNAHIEIYSCLVSPTNKDMQFIFFYIMKVMDMPLNEFQSAKFNLKSQEHFNY